MRMIKYPVTILLLLLTAIQTFSKWCVIAEFRLNRDYIAKNLCVNRLKPCCCCKGKCYLNKKLAADESQQQTPKGIQQEETPFQLNDRDHLLPDPVIHIIATRYATRYLDGTPQDYIPSFFAPPRETMFFA